jgi:hypothetical protein
MLLEEAIVPLRSKSKVKKRMQVAAMKPRRAACTKQLMLSAFDRFVMVARSTLRANNNSTNSLVRAGGLRLSSCGFNRRSFLDCGISFFGEIFLVDFA